jgi:hypothetical protein
MCPTPRWQCSLLLDLLEVLVYRGRDEERQRLGVHLSLGNDEEEEEAFDLDMFEGTGPEEVPGYEGVERAEQVEQDEAEEADKPTARDDGEGDGEPRAESIRTGTPGYRLLSDHSGRPGHGREPAWVVLCAGREEASWSRGAEAGGGEDEVEGAGAGAGTEQAILLLKGEGRGAEMLQLEEWTILL